MINNLHLSENTKTRHGIIRIKLCFGETFPTFCGTELFHHSYKYVPSECHCDIEFFTCFCEFASDTQLSGNIFLLSCNSLNSPNFPYSSKVAINHGHQHHVDSPHNYVRHHPVSYQKVFRLFLSIFSNWHTNIFFKRIP